MISYEPFWDTMEKRKVSKYTLIYKWNISSNTLRRMSHNEPINTTTLNQLCLILNCKPQDIIRFEITDEEKAAIHSAKLEMKSKTKK